MERNIRNSLSFDVQKEISSPSTLLKSSLYSRKIGVNTQLTWKQEEQTSKTNFYVKYKFKLVTKLMSTICTHKPK